MTLVNETNLVHYLFLVQVRILSILFITSTCFGPLQVRRQEEQLYLCDTWYSFCIADCLVCRSICSCVPVSYTQ